MATTTKRGTRRVVPRVSDRAPRMPDAEPIAQADSLSIAIWITLSALWTARALLTFVHSMCGWSLNGQRFLSPVAGWTLWTLSALGLAPTLARGSWGS